MSLVSDAFKEAEFQKKIRMQKELSDAEDVLRYIENIIRTALSVKRVCNPRGYECMHPDRWKRRTVNRAFKERRLLKNIIREIRLRHAMESK